MTSLLLPTRPKILIVRRDNIGDLVCTTPAITALRRRYPEAEIAALVNSYNAEVLNGNPNLDHVFVYHKLKHEKGIVDRLKAISLRLKLIVRLRQWKPDVTILAKASYEQHGLNFARQIGAKNIVGYVPDDLCQVKGLPDIQLKTPEFNALHEVEAVNQLLAPFGIYNALGPLKVYPDAEVVKQRMQKLRPALKRIAIHVSARERERRWGANKFIALIKHILNDEPSTQIFLFWSPGNANDPRHPGDDETAQRLIQALGSEQLIPMQTQSITELIALLSHCNLYIGTDGGALHLAVGLHKPCVALFENLPSKLNHWYPWRVPFRIVRGEQPDVSSIEIGQVVAALASLESELAQENSSITPQH